MNLAPRSLTGTCWFCLFRYLNSKPIKESNHYKITISIDRRTVTLTIFDITIEDDAEYTVKAKNPSGEISMTAELIVLPAGESPEFKKKLTEVDVTIGSTITLECQVTGKPRPQISWLKDGKEMKPDKRFKYVSFLSFSMGYYYFFKDCANLTH
jgi:hypothetical protein